LSASAPKPVRGHRSVCSGLPTDPAGHGVGRLTRREREEELGLAQSEFRQAEAGLRKLPYDQATRRGKKSKGTRRGSQTGHPASRAGDERSGISPRQDSISGDRKQRGTPEPTFKPAIIPGQKLTLNGVETFDVRRAGWSGIGHKANLVSIEGLPFKKGPE